MANNINFGVEIPQEEEIAFTDNDERTLVKTICIPSFRNNPSKVIVPEEILYYSIFGFGTYSYGGRVPTTATSGIVSISRSAEIEFAVAGGSSNEITIGINGDYITLPGMNDYQRFMWIVNFYK